MKRFLLVAALAGPALAQSPAVLTSEAALAWERDAATRCRTGVPDTQPTWQACGEREAYARVLNTMGWCYGRRGEPAARMAWHRCASNSIAPTGGQQRN